MSTTCKGLHQNPRRQEWTHRKFMKFYLHLCTHNSILVRHMIHESKDRCYSLIVSVLSQVPTKFMLLYYLSMRLYETDDKGSACRDFPLTPRTAVKILFSVLNLKRVRMWLITSAYSSFFFCAIRVAILL